MRRLTLLLALVPAAGLVELALHQYFATRAPRQADYAALAPELAKLKRPGVPVVVAPAWAEPLLRQAAPEAFPLVELARPDDSGFTRFLEVSLLGATAPELEGFATTQTQQFGAFRISLRENPRPDPTRFDFVSAVERGEVEIYTELEAERLPCQRVERSRAETGGLHGHVAYPKIRYECARGRFVGVTLIDDQYYRPRRCVLAQPPAAGSVVLRFRTVPATPRLVGFVGSSYFIARDDVKPELELTISEADQSLLRRTAAGVQGWSRYEARRPAEPGAVEVHLRRLTRDAADFCFSLEAR
jgi:hypothetical protein